MYIFFHVDDCDGPSFVGFLNYNVCVVEYFSKGSLSLPRTVGFNAMWCVRNEIIVMASSVIDKWINKGVSAFGWSPTCYTAVDVYRWFVGIYITEKIFMLTQTSANLYIIMANIDGSANIWVLQKDRPNCRNLWWSVDKLKSYRLAMLECLVKFAWWFLLWGKLVEFLKENLPIVRVWCVNRKLNIVLVHLVLGIFFAVPSMMLPDETIYIYIYA